MSTIIESEETQNITLFGIVIPDQEVIVRIQQLESKWIQPIFSLHPELIANLRPMMLLILLKGNLDFEEINRTRKLSSELEFIAQALRIFAYNFTGAESVDFETFLHQARPRTFGMPLTSILTDAPLNIEELESGSSVFDMEALLYDFQYSSGTESYPSGRGTISSLIFDMSLSQLVDVQTLGNGRLNIIQAFDEWNTQNISLVNTVIGNSQIRVHI